MSDLAARAAEIRRIAVSLIYGAGSGHPGSCLSAADLIAALYFQEMRVGTDRFVLSKGHGCPALYAALHLRGFFDRAALGSFRRLGGMLQGSPSTNIPGVDATCGSLGQGFSIALGIALGFRQRHMDGRVFVMLGDGELQEGEVWEAAMCAGHYGLGHLCAIVDYNKMQSDDLNDRIMKLEPLAAKWRAFGWNVREIDGHNFDEIDQSLEDSLKVMHWMARHLLERKYTIGKRRYFADGMLQQHVLSGITPDGTPFRMPACIVFTMKDGKIARLEEYLDTAQTAPLRAS
jgi:transketolase